MSRFNETVPSNIPEEKLLLEDYPLIPVEEQKANNPNREKWLFVLPTLQNAAPFSALANYSMIKDDSPFSAIFNSTIMRDSQWFDGMNAADILLRRDPDTPVGENDQIKIYDTRTFVRPRKSRMSSSPFQHSKGFLNGDGSPWEHLARPNNNNLYLFNNTSTVDAVSIYLPTNDVPKNATSYSEDGPVQGPTAVTRHRDIDMEELEEEEEVFRRPLLPDWGPEKSFLIQSSTLDSEAICKNASDNISTPIAYALERIAKHQEESSAQTSMAMGQRQFPPHRTPIEGDHNQGSPILSMAGPAHEGSPILISALLASNNESNSDSTTQIVRGHLTLEKSQNSVEAQPSSLSSPMGSTYSSQSIESDGTGCAAPPTAQSMLQRSTPNLSNVSRLRMPKTPSTLMASGNLNRQHGSETGIRPPSSSGIRTPVGKVVNGPLSFRPQLPVPETATLKVPNAVKPSQPQQSTRSANPSPRNSLLPVPSRLKHPQLIASGRTPVGSHLHPPLAEASAHSDESSSTDVVGKPVILKPNAVPQPTAVAAPAFSGIPRPSMVSRIPGPRTVLKSSFPIMGFRPRAP